MIRNLKLETRGNSYQLKNALKDAIKNIEMWEKTEPEDDHWYSYSSSGSFSNMLDIIAEN